MENASLAYRIGNARITRIFETHFDLPPERLFPDWVEAKGSRLAASLSARSLDVPARKTFLQTHLWVVEIDGLTLVVDTGIGNGKSRPFSPLFDQLDNPVLERFEAAGFSRDDVDYVLLTHLHVDHVGWNTYFQDGQWLPLFPNATYVFSQKEYDYFSSAAGAPRRMVRDDSVQPLVVAGKARMVAPRGGMVAEHIRFLPTPGHSIDHMAIEIESQGETALFSGDVMHSPVQIYRPEWSSMFCLDGALARRSRQWILDRAVEKAAMLFPAHFPETSAGRVRKGVDGFEWEYAPAVAKTGGNQQATGTTEGGSI
jgi:glyoxylase-like metal-dependent hydrolase (beta-lactamase superfamily II)